MLGRKIVVDVIKDKDAPVEDEEEIAFDQRALHVSATINYAIANVSKAVAIYVVLDTARKIAVNRLSK